VKRECKKAALTPCRIGNEIMRWFFRGAAYLRFKLREGGDKDALLTFHPLAAELDRIVDLIPSIL